MKIQELRRTVRRAIRRAGLTEDDIRKLGDLRKKRTWQLAYDNYCRPRLSESDRELLFGEVEFKADASGQLCLFEFANTFEPPDPDDYQDIDSFNSEWQRWEQEFPNHAAALRRWAQLEVAAHCRSP
ncbi:MAG: hypothetical protein AB4080_01955 [Trichodesmium sp.]